MRSVVDQIPRLLAAMEYIAQEDKGSAGSFEMFLAFSVVRRIFQTGVIELLEMQQANDWFERTVCGGN